VTIYPDPDAEGVTPAHLKAFERGKYGPIFAPKQSQQSTATQPAPSYTYAPTAASTGYGTQGAVPRDFSYPMSTIPSGYTAPGGYPASGGYSAPGGYAVSAGYPVSSGYASSSGHTAPSGHATTQAAQSTDTYDENDQEDDEPEGKDS